MPLIRGFQQFPRLVRGYVFFYEPPGIIFAVAHPQSLGDDARRLFGVPRLNGLISILYASVNSHPNNEAP